MSKQQADVFTLHAVMKELILPGVKFIPNGDAGRALLKYTDDESSLCHKVIAFTGRTAAGDNVAWWKQMSKRIRQALANYRNNTMTAMRRTYTGEYECEYCERWIDTSEHGITVIESHHIAVVIYMCVLALYESASDGHSPTIWSPLAICDVGAVAEARRGAGNGIPYAWLICMFLKNIANQHKWQSLVTRAMEQTNPEFRLSQYFSRSDEAFMLAVLHGKGPGWKEALVDKQKAAWTWFVVSVVEAKWSWWVYMMQLCILTHLCVLS